MAQSDKHLILDVSVIINLWLGGESAGHVENLLDRASQQGTHMWIVASSISTLDFVARNRFKQTGIDPEDVGRLVSTLMGNLFQTVEVLTSHGFEQKEIYQKAKDFEDAQIAAAIRSLKGASVCIVTEDVRFDALGEVLVQSPLEALNWLKDQKQTKNSIPFIDLAGQQHRILPKIEKGITGVLRHGQYIMGPEVAELEEKLAEYVGVKHCITASSGTDTLLIALMALGIGPGDEVITSPFTFIATGEMIALAGATPVFVDIDPRTYNIDPAKIEAAITPRTKAIMPVSLYGQCADFDAINAIVEKHNKTRESWIVNGETSVDRASCVEYRSTINDSRYTASQRSTTNDPQIYVIEDGAQSFGATYKGRRSCGLSTIGSTSFFPSKPLGCYGDGGALFTNDDALAKAMREIRAHGQDRRYHHPRLGVNGRFDTIQAAILLAKLEIFDQEVQARAQIGTHYTELLTSQFTIHDSLHSDSRSTIHNSRITVPYIEPHNTSVYAQYTVQVDNRDEVAKKLASGQWSVNCEPNNTRRDQQSTIGDPRPLSIPTAVHYPVPLHLQPVFAELGLQEGSFPHSEAAGKRVMSLPMHPYMKERDQVEIATMLCEAVQ